MTIILDNHDHLRDGENSFLHNVDRLHALFFSRIIDDITS